MTTKKFKHIPLDRGHPITGHLREFQRDRFTMQMRFMKEMGDIYSFYVGRFPVIYLSNPKYIRHVLQENYKNYKKNIFYDELRIILGQGLVTSEGEFWRKQRKMIQPTFHHSQIEKFITLMTNATDKMIVQWENSAKAQRQINIDEDMKTLTMEIVAQCLFSHDTDVFAQNATQSTNIVLDWAKHRLESLIKLPHWIPTKDNREFKQAYTELNEIIMGLIQERRAMKERPNDLLTTLIELTDEQSKTGMTDNQLFDEILTLFMAGHETTAHTLVWTWTLLSKHPHIRNKLNEEVDEVLKKSSLSFDTINALSYTKMVLQESMRIIPAVWGIGREAINDDEIDGYPIPKGATVGVSIYQMHHHPAFWENPEGFIPERFLPENLSNVNKWVYMPFGGGPRMCIGNAFAMMEAQIILSMLSNRFTLDLDPGIPIEFDPGITLRPKHELFMDIKAR